MTFSDYSPRHRQILDILSDQSTVPVYDLAHQLGVSQETIRRDVKLMAARGDILRMHGSIALPSLVSEAPFEKRMRANRDAKEAIAQLAATTIRDGESVMLDCGTTTSYLARALLDHHRLTVVTNSSDIARTLATVNGNRVYMAGGELRSDNGAALGHSAIEFINRFHVDHAIISAGGINPLTGVMDYDLEEAQFGEAVLSRGSRRLVVSDASKFGKKAIVRVCPFDGIDEIFIDKMPDTDLQFQLEGANVGIRCVSQ